MANIAGSKKRARQNVKCYETNRFHKSTMRSKIKAFRNALTDRNTADEVQALLASVIPAAVKVLFLRIEHLATSLASPKHFAPSTARETPKFLKISAATLSSMES